MAGLAGASMVSEHGKTQDAFGDQPKIQFGSLYVGTVGDDVLVDLKC